MKLGLVYMVLYLSGWHLCPRHFPSCIRTRKQQNRASSFWKHPIWTDNDRRPLVRIVDQSCKVSRPETVKTRDRERMWLLWHVFWLWIQFPKWNVGNCHRCLRLDLLNFFSSQEVFRNIHPCPTVKSSMNYTQKQVPDDAKFSVDHQVCSRSHSAWERLELQVMRRIKTAKLVCR